MEPSGKSKSTCLYIAIGCGGAVLLGAIVLGALGFWGYRQAKQIEEELKDPEARAAKVYKILGAETLPEGYYAGMGFSVPFLMDFAILTDEPPKQEGPVEDVDDVDIGDPAFIYLKMLSFGKQEQELRDFFDGTADDASVLRDQGINVDLDEILGRGSLEMEDHSILWVANRGDVTTGTGRRKGIATIMLVECPDDEKLRMGIWTGEDPAPELPPEEVDLAGSPADPQAIVGFMGHFHLCG